MAYRKGQSGGVSPATRITQEIIARLESGTKPWIKPWRGVPVSRPLRACGIPYRGMNVFWLWMVADMCGYASPFWMTYNQAKELGAQVRKGEKSTIAIFYKSYTKEVEAPHTGEKTDESRRVLKAYPVFNADQVEGLPERFHPAATLEVVEPKGRQAELDSFFASIPAVLRHQGDEAYYEPVADRVTMPPAHLFSGFDHYYATLAHELSHNAVTRIMPCGLWFSLVFWRSAARRFGIIKVLPGMRGVDRRAGTGLTAWAEQRRGQAPFLSSACRRGCRSGWSRRFRDQARVRSPLDQHRDAAGPSRCCGAAYVA
ncbi:Antirestriction protein [Novosphingobium sp. PP1Y]|nr:Antirestriction protein [Novosphingobium sp. PP1Y]